MMLFGAGVLVGWLLAWAFEVWFWRVRRRESATPRIFLAESLRSAPRGPGARAGAIGADLLRAPIETGGTAPTPKAAVQMLDPEAVSAATPSEDRAVESLRLSELLRPRPVKNPVVTGALAHVYDPPRLRLAEPTPGPVSSALEAWPGQEPEPTEALEDDFTRINGIGPVYQKRLKLANVRSFVDLACTHPATILAIIQPRHPNMVQVHQWVAEARVLARAE